MPVDPLTEPEYVPPFCPRDGEPMVMEREHRGFDTQSGEPIIRVIAHCRRRWHRYLDESWELNLHTGTDGITVYDWSNL